MTSSFKQWLKHGLKESKHGGGYDKPPEPPYREGWPNILASTTNTRLNSGYGLFQTLPLEIRQQILSQAFGNRTLHVDLAYDHPLVRKSQSKKNRRRTFLSKRADEKPEGRRRHCGLGSDLVRDASKPKQWQWFSCVCHRRVVKALQPEPEPHARPQLRIEPCNDGCLDGGLFAKRYGPNDQWGVLCRCEQPMVSYDRPMADHECFIGIMGWLLACPQAYIEGIDILYRTNAFHISSLPLLLNLPRLMPPRHLTAITCLELLWDFSDDCEIIKATYERAQAPRSPPLPPSTKFHELCQMVPRIFPNALDVYVALQATIYPPLSEAPADRMPLLERAILGPVEDMLRAMGPAPEKEFSVAIQMGGFLALAMRHWRDNSVNRSFYTPTRHPVDGRGYLILDGVSFTAIRAWRPVGDGGAGYWLRPGLSDSLPPGHEMLDIWGPSEDWL